MSDLDCTQILTADDSISSVGDSEAYLKLVSPVDNVATEYPLAKETTIGRSFPSDIIIPVQVLLTPNVLYALKYGDELIFGDITCTFEKSSTLMTKQSGKQLSYISATSALQDGSYSQNDSEFSLPTSTERRNGIEDVKHKSLVNIHSNNTANKDSAGCIPSTQTITDSYDDDIEPVQPMKIWNGDNNRMIRSVTQVRIPSKLANSSSPMIDDESSSSSSSHNSKQNGIGSEQQSSDQLTIPPIKSSSSLLNNNDNFEEYYADEILIGCNTVPATLPLIEQTNLNMNDQLEIVSSSQPVQPKLQQQNQDAGESEQVNITTMTTVSTTITTTTTTTTTIDIEQEIKTDQINELDDGAQSYDLGLDEKEMVINQQGYIGDSEEIKSSKEVEQQDVSSRLSEQIPDEVITLTEITKTTSAIVITTPIIDIPYDMQQEIDNELQNEHSGESSIVSARSTLDDNNEYDMINDRDKTISSNLHMPEILQTPAYQMMPDNNMQDKPSQLNEYDQDLSMAPLVDISSKTFEEENLIKQQSPQSVITSQEQEESFVDNAQMDTNDRINSSDNAEPLPIESNELSKTNDVELEKVTTDRNEDQMQQISSKLSESRPSDENEATDTAENVNDRPTSNVLDDKLTEIPYFPASTSVEVPSSITTNVDDEIDTMKDVSMTKIHSSQETSTENDPQHIITMNENTDQVGLNEPSEPQTSVPAGEHSLSINASENQESVSQNANDGRIELNAIDSTDKDIEVTNRTTTDESKFLNEPKVQTEVDNNIAESADDEPLTSEEGTLLKPSRPGVPRKHARRAHGRQQKVVSSKLHGTRGRRNAIIPTLNETVESDTPMDETINTENEDNVNISVSKKEIETLPIEQDEKVEETSPSDIIDEKKSIVKPQEENSSNVRHSRRIQERASSGKLRGFPYDDNEYVDLDELEKHQTNRKSKTLSSAKSPTSKPQSSALKRKSLRQQQIDDHQKEEQKIDEDSSAEQLEIGDEEVQDTRKGSINKRKRKTTAPIATTPTGPKRNRTSEPTKGRILTNSASATKSTPLTGNRRRKLPLSVTPDVVNDQTPNRSLSSTANVSQAKRQKRSNQPLTPTNVSTPPPPKTEENSGRTRSKSKTPKSARTTEDEQKQDQQQLVPQTSASNARQSSRQQPDSSNKRSSSKSNKKQKTDTKTEVEEVEEKRPVRIALSSHLNFDQRQLDLLKKLGFDIIDESCQVDVLVVDRIRRTKKFFMCLGRGAHIVSPTWIDTMLRDEKYYPIDKFYLNDQQAEQRYGFNLKESVRLAKQRPIFGGYKIFCTKDTSPPYEDLKDIIEAAGGKLIDKVNMLRPAKDLICIVAQKHKQEYESLHKRNVPIVSEEFALSGISKQRLDFDMFSLFTTLGPSALTPAPPVTASQNIVPTSTTQSIVPSSASQIPTRK
ncbi:unnamed protein product [Didymodactylos carnosus]|uniref:PAX-interacting protein 1 n=1 Tax=Didymodactylos carnosus TaxID=1234261 RepID=A0A814WF33_9BILA|nr:unnamed protein product [Didymodactylos carnosus]CAF3964963.1 unnamed protein product [Didymodactylos carnosus]